MQKTKYRLFWRGAYASVAFVACWAVAYISYQSPGRRTSVIVPLRPGDPNAIPTAEQLVWSGGRPVGAVQGDGASPFNDRNVDPRPPQMLADAGGTVDRSNFTEVPNLTAGIHAQSSQAGSSSQSPEQPSVSPAALEAVQTARRLESAATAHPTPANFRAALAALRNAIALNPEDKTLQCSAAFIAYEKLEEPDEAIPHLLVAAQVDPAWESTLAEAYEKTGDLPKALATREAIVEDNPGSTWDWVAIGKLNARLGDRKEAEAAFRSAMQSAPGNADVALCYAEFLIAENRRDEARQLVEATLAKHPDSKWGYGMLGDLYIADEQPGLARDAYKRAIQIDKNWYPATAGLLALDRSRAPKLNSAFYQFNDTNDFDQMGQFNTLSYGLTDQLFVHGSMNVRWFDSPGISTVHRLEESVLFDYRLDPNWTIQAGATAFQTEGSGGDEVGGVAAVYWIDKPFNAHLNARLNEPVNDSIVTAVDGYSQDVIAGGFGWQITDRLSISTTGSWSRYSDDNDRYYLNVDVGYTIVPEWNLSARLQYEMIRFDEQTPLYSSPDHYQYIRPIIEAKPTLTPWAKLAIRAEVPYVVEEGGWGTGIEVGPELKLGEHLTLEAVYFRYDLPGEFASYSGDGFKVSLRLTP